MIQPNSSCALFCDWLLNVSWQKLSTAQRNLVDVINTAALTFTQVTDQEWENFNKFTAWRYPFYLVYHNNQTTGSLTLLSGLLATWSMEGNSNDPVNGNNGADTAIIYSAANGKILQGALFNGASSKILIPYSASLNDASAERSINLWVRLDGAAVSILLARFYTAVDLTYFFLFDGTQFQAKTDGGTGTIVALAPAALNTWYMLTMCFTSNTNMEFFINGVSQGSTGAPGALTSLNFPLQLGSYQSSLYLPGSLDMVSLWNRILSQTEIDELYALGAGLQYPF
jgi:hypothetical protein